MLRLYYVMLVVAQLQIDFSCYKSILHVTGLSLTLNDFRANRQLEATGGAPSAPTTAPPSESGESETSSTRGVGAFSAAKHGCVV